MLQSLMIKNIALIEQVSIMFHDGLHALTGETGAGKSIVVDAVNLVLGSRADKNLIRSGCEKASVEARFILPETHRARQFLMSEAIEPEDNTVTIYREITVTGRNTCRVCGVIVPLATLKTIAETLMDIHGQNDHHFLLNPELHLAFLDQMGDAVHQQKMDSVKKACRKFLENHREYAKKIKMEKNRGNRLPELEKELESILTADLHPGDEEKYREEYKRLHEMKKSRETLQSINNLFSPEDSEGCVDILKNASRMIRSATDKMPALKDISDKIESLYYEAEESGFQISKLMQEMDSNPERIQELEDKLSLISDLKRKYGETDQILQAGEQIKQEVEEYMSLDTEIKALAAEHKSLLAEYRRCAEVLSQSRHQIAEVFSGKMKDELSLLGMEHTEFQVAFRENDTGKPLMPTEAGDDRAEFMISPNPGEPLKPMAQIASGGELSRIMLAVKVLESGTSGIGSMVFDEIDTGISGRMAQVVAEKMIKVSASQQVICVTHLPQIAAAADYQYLVTKEVREDRTYTEVTELNREARIQELARMISGAGGINQEAIEYGEKILEYADDLKKQR